MNSFYGKNPDLINIARKEFFKNSAPSINGLTVLETGCGPRGIFTQMLLDMGGIVTSQDAREDCIKELKKLKLNIETDVYDLNKENCIQKDYDVIFSYGTFYHLDNPSIALKNMCLRTNKFIFISTILYPSKEKKVILEKENKKASNQSFTGGGCRPTKSWMIYELKKYFCHVYMPLKPPNHPEFPLELENRKYQYSFNKNTRGIFLATNEETLINKDLWV